MRCSRCDAEMQRGSRMCCECGRFSWSEAVAKPDASPFVPLSDVADTVSKRIHTGEWDAVWGGVDEPGIDCESIYMFAGFPGVGKSTLAFQTIAPIVEATARPCLYLGDEQSPHKLARQWRRLSLPRADLVLAPRERGDLDYPLSPSILALEPCAIVQDSLPGFAGADYQRSLDILSGFRAIADSGVPVFVINHVNSDGEMAGWMQFEHLVDAVLMIEPVRRRDEPWRRFRSLKSRLGSTESMILEMGREGLRAHTRACECEVCEDERE